MSQQLPRPPSLPHRRFQPQRLGYRCLPVFSSERLLSIHTGRRHDQFMIEWQTAITLMGSPLPVNNSSTAHRQHHAESCLAAHHTIVGCRRLFEREGLDHRPNASQRTEVERVFRIFGGP